MSLDQETKTSSGKPPLSSSPCSRHPTHPASLASKKPSRGSRKHETLASAKQADGPGSSGYYRRQASEATREDSRPTSTVSSRKQSMQEDSLGSMLGLDVPVGPPLAYQASRARKPRRSSLEYEGLGGDSSDSRSSMPITMRSLPAEQILAALSPERMPPKLGEPFGSSVSCLGLGQTAAPEPATWHVPLRDSWRSQHDAAVRFQLQRFLGRAGRSESGPLRTMSIPAGGPGAFANDGSQSDWYAAALSEPGRDPVRPVRTQSIPAAAALSYGPDQVSLSFGTPAPSEPGRDPVSPARTHSIPTARERGRDSSAVGCPGEAAPGLHSPADLHKDLAPDSEEVTRLTTVQAARGSGECALFCDNEALESSCETSGSSGTQMAGGAAGLGQRGQRQGQDRGCLEGSSSSGSPASRPLRQQCFKAPKNDTHEAPRTSSGQQGSGCDYHSPTRCHHDQRPATSAGYRTTKAEALTPAGVPAKILQGEGKNFGGSQPSGNPETVTARQEVGLDQWLGAPPRRVSSVSNLPAILGRQSASHLGLSPLNPGFRARTPSILGTPETTLQQQHRAALQFEIQRILSRSSASLLKSQVPPPAPVPSHGGASQLLKLPEPAGLEKKDPSPDTGASEEDGGALRHCKIYGNLSLKLPKPIGCEEMEIPVNCKAGEKDPWASGELQGEMCAGPETSAQQQQRVLRKQRTTGGVRAPALDPWYTTGGRGRRHQKCPGRERRSDRQILEHRARGKDSSVCSDDPMSRGAEMGRICPQMLRKARQQLPRDKEVKQVGSHLKLEDDPDACSERGSETESGGGSESDDELTLTPQAEFNVGLRGRATGLGELPLLRRSSTAATEQGSTSSSDEEFLLRSRTYSASFVVTVKK